MEPFSQKLRPRDVPPVVPSGSRKVPTMVPSHSPGTAASCHLLPLVATCTSRRKWRPVLSLRAEAAIEQRLRTAEGTGLEPATPCGASDFESDSSPFGYPPKVILAQGLTAARADHMSRRVSRNHGCTATAALHSRTAATCQGRGGDEHQDCDKTDHGFFRWRVFGSAGCAPACFS